MPTESERLIAFLHLDEHGNELGPVVVNGMPMMLSADWATMEKMDLLREMAGAAATASGMTIREVEFTRNRLFNCREYKP